MEAAPNLEKGSDVIKKFTQHIESHGVSDMENLMRSIKDEITEYEKIDVNLAITGQSGAGKSSMINCLRNIRADEPSAALVGCTETTMTLTPYKHPDLPKVVLWDLPGVNTPNFPKESYEEKVGIGRFDALILCSSTRFLENDLWLAQRAYDRQIPYYCVRTKIDQDVLNDKEDYEDRHDEVKLLMNMKSDIQKQMTKAGLPSDRVYLISTKIKHQTKWDFDAFQRELINNAPSKNRTALVMALVAGSEQCIESKRNGFEERIDNVAKEAVQNQGKEIEIIQAEVNQYRQRFGITESNFKKWGVKTDNMQKDLQDITKNLGHLDLLLEERKQNLARIADATVVSSTIPQAVVAIPYVGALAMLIGGVIDSIKGRKADDKHSKDVEKAKQNVETAKEMRDTAASEAEDKRQLMVTKHTRDVLTESLNHYAELAKGVLRERQKNLI